MKESIEEAIKHLTIIYNATTNSVEKTQYGTTLYSLKIKLSRYKTH